ncbi:hypothetical protein D3C84_1270420 [compost metagenome]
MLRIIDHQQIGSTEHFLQLLRRGSATNAQTDAGGPCGLSLAQSYPGILAGIPLFVILIVGKPVGDQNQQPVGQAYRVTQ